MSIIYSLDELILWDHPNSHLIILQSKRILTQYDVCFDSGFQECRLSNAQYEIKRVDGGRKAYCRYTLPGSAHKLFVANGGIQCDKYASMRLATFRVIQQIFTYIYDFNWETIEFHLTPTRDGGFRCKSSKIKLPARGASFSSKHNTNHFRTERITHARDRSKNYPAYCRIAAGIEFIEKLCKNLEYIGAAHAFRMRRYGSNYGWKQRDRAHSSSFKHNGSKKHHRRPSIKNVHASAIKHRKNGSGNDFGYYKKYHPNKTRPKSAHHHHGHKSRSGSTSKHRIEPVVIRAEAQSADDVGVGFNFRSLLDEVHVTHMHKYRTVNEQQNIERNLLNVQKNLEYEPGKEIMHRKCVDEWNYYAIIYWFNRVNNCAFSDIKYTNLRKHLYIGRVKGRELGKINEVLLKMAGILDVNEHVVIMKAIHALIQKDDVYNVAANAIRTDNIPNCFFDPITYEIMQDPVVCAVSGNLHERRIIEEYIKTYHKDPCTQKMAGLHDLVANNEMKQKIDIWLRANADLEVV